MPSVLAAFAAAGAIGAVVAGCGKGASKPEADPAKVHALARRMLENTPAPAGAPSCTHEHLGKGVTLTATTLLRLAKEPVPDKPERADWVNPPELDAPAARTLVDAKASETARRQAAAELLAAPGYVVYRPDMVNVPMALGVKELKRGALGMRAIAYDKHGAPTCLLVFTVQNDRELSEWAMMKSDRARIDPEIAQKLRDDLTVQLRAKIDSLRTPPAS